MEKDTQKIHAVLKQHCSKMTNRELLDELSRQGVTASVAEVQAALRRLGLSREIESRVALPSRKRKVETLSLHRERSKESKEYDKALKEFGAACGKKKKKKFAEAAKAFAAVEKHYSDERELLERAQAYRKAAERQAGPASEPSPKGFEDTLMAGVVWMNARDFDKAGTALKKAMQNASSGAQKARAHYALASLAAKTEKSAEAIESLEEALEADPQFRIQLRDDVDFRHMRDMPEFRSLLVSPLKKSA